MNKTLALALAAVLVFLPLLAVQMPRFRLRAVNEMQEKKEAKHEPEGIRTFTWGPLWATLAFLGVLLLLVAYALLIAWCLALFIVYQTEARLGEARRGLVQGGEMRLCLCARG